MALGVEVGAQLRLFRFSYQRRKIFLCHRILVSVQALSAIVVDVGRMQVTKSVGRMVALVVEETLGVIEGRVVQLEGALFVPRYLIPLPHIGSLLWGDWRRSSLWKLSVGVTFRSDVIVAAQVSGDRWSADVATEQRWYRLGTLLKRLAIVLDAGHEVGPVPFYVASS